MSRSCSRSRRSAAAFALSLALAGAPAARGEEPWQELYRDAGVTISERAPHDGPLPDVRGEVEIPAELYEVLAVILDIPNQTAWMWQCRVSRVLRSEGDASLIYQVIDARWPATDRDVVLRSVPSVLEPGHRLSVQFENREDAAAPPVADLVRMSRLAGAFALEALGGSHTRVTYTVSADPGGALPVAFLERTVRESPYDTLVGLRRRVAETRGRYARVADDWRSRAATPR